MQVTNGDKAKNEKTNLQFVAIFHFINKGAQWQILRIAVPESVSLSSKMLVKYHILDHGWDNA